MVGMGTQISIEDFVQEVNLLVEWRDTGSVSQCGVK